MEEASSKHTLVEETQPFAEYLKAIKFSLTNKEKMVEKMKRKLVTEQVEE